MPLDPQILPQNLTAAQREAITHIDGPCLVVAGAGTGKTKVITHRIAYLIQEVKVPPEQIVALTFTDKAAREMEERVDKLLPYGTFGTVISTFHSFCADILKRHSFLLGLDPNGKLMSSAEEISFLRQNLAELPSKIYKPNYNPVEFLRSFISFMSRAKDEAIAPEAVIRLAVSQKAAAKTEAESEEALKLEELGNLYAAAERLYQKNGVLAYGDLISYTYQLLKQFPSSLAEEQKRISYLLIDEFQDTNYIQSEVANLLAASQRNIMAVGDDDQAIYSFRGATLGNILNFSTIYPETKRIALRENFRSTQPILDAAYRLIQNNNPLRLEIQEGISKQLISQEKDGETPKHWQFERGAFEYEAVTSEIIRLIKEEGYPPEEIAVLIRAKSQLGGLENALQGKKIPYQYAGDGKFYNLPIIQTVISFLRFLVNPDDDLNLFFCLTEPPFQVPERELQPLLASARYQKLSLFELLLQPAELEPALKESLEFLHARLGHSLSELPSQLFLHFLHDSHLYEQLQSNILANEQLATFYEEIIAYESLHPHCRLPNYLQHLEYLIATDEDISLKQPLSPVREGVQLLTVHKSKGLEFRAVFVINLVQGRFPSRSYSDRLPFPYELTHYNKGEESKTDNLPEERRLAYVAFTRARERLYLTSSELYEDRKTKAKPSPFINEALGLESAPAVHSQKAEEILAKPTHPELPKASPKPLPISFSPSALDTYLDCPKKYEYQYVLKIKVPASFQTNFGISVHETLRAWFAARQQGKSLDLEELYRSCWVNGGYENHKHEEERYQEGLSRLKEYLDSLPSDCQPVALESACQVVFEDGNRLTGKIDRIDQTTKGGYRLIDYKTSESPKDPRELREDIPLGIYLLSLERQGKKVESVELHYVMVGERVVLGAEELNLDEIKRKAKGIMDEIQNSLPKRHFPAKPSKFICSYCEYNKICPFRYGKT